MKMEGKGGNGKEAGTENPRQKERHVLHRP